MGQDNLDKHVKNILAERKIQPSNAAWEQLEAQLDAESAKKPNRKRFLYAIAASIILLLGYVVVQLNKEQSSLLPVNKVATESSTKKQLKNEEHSLGNAVVNQHQDTAITKVSPVEALNTANSIVKRTNTPTTIQEVKPKIQLNESLSVVQEKHENELINVLPEPQTTVSDAATEASVLLEEALAELKNTAKQNTPITPKSTVETATISVDPETLLMEVEATAEESLRATIFEKLKEGFKKTKTAVATRND